VKLLWVVAVFTIVTLTIFLPTIRLFSGLTIGGQDAKLYREAKLIATIADSLTSEGSTATIEVSIPAGRIVIGNGYVEAQTSRGDVKRFEANVNSSLVLERGRHIIKIEYDDSAIKVTTRD